MNRTHFVLTAMSILLGLSLNIGAQSLTDKLSEDQTFYRNYGKDQYSKLSTQKDVIGLYDQFGVHITDGVNIYEFNNSVSKAKNDRLDIDSTLYSNSKEYQRQDFYENFNNLVITQDAIGGFKTAFLIGDQITTKFSPLTYNQTNFRGIRWDSWTSNFQASVLVSRTRPGFLSKKDQDGTSEVSYPLKDFSYSGGMNGSADDYSTKSPYGDYDMLLALHAENTIANKVDVGVSYINHHMSDVKRGEKWFKGEVPDEWLPGEVHFEFYDATAQDTLDAGVFVEDIRMLINGREVKANPLYASKFRGVYQGDENGLLLPYSIPMARPVNGYRPVIVTFAINPEYFKFVDGGTQLGSSQDIKSIRFQYIVAGNYKVFVSTDRQIPLAMKAIIDPQTNKKTFVQPQKSVSEIADRTVPVDASSSGRYDSSSVNQSTSYFGEYISKAPKNINVSANDFTVACQSPRNALHSDPFKYNYKTLSYEYNVNISSVTYGVNFKGELAGIKFSGEFAFNQSKDKMPSAVGDRVTTNKWVGQLKAERELGKNFGINAEGYYIAPQWQTNRNYLLSSEYFNQTLSKVFANPDYINSHGGYYYADYMAYPRPMGEAKSWSNIDDNDDNDLFAENNRRRYPADQGSDAQTKFSKDGTMDNYGSKWVSLPNKLWLTYDDPDGVVSSKGDRNRNSIADYEENFLLYSSDPPVFELGNDLNNNGIPDKEDDDLLPDFGHPVGYTITGDGITTQGIRGLSMNLRWTPKPDFTVDVGAIAEGVVDRDFNDKTNSIDENVDDIFDGNSYVAYLTGKKEIIRRSQGLQYTFGGEFRYIRDAFRNDAVLSLPVTGSTDYNYRYYVDPLDYRHAAVGNLIADVGYNNIRNFEYGFKLQVGAENRFAIDEEFYNSYPIYNSVYNAYYNIEHWDKYYGRLIGSINAVNRLGYTFSFKNEFEGWRSVFNKLNNLQIIPQYKIGFSMREELKGPIETSIDPRKSYLSLDFERRDKDNNHILYEDELDYSDSLINVLINEQNLWAQYKANHSINLMNVPILRVEYKIAENTKIQYGFQWLKKLDVVSPQSSFATFTNIVQVVSRATYRGYTVTFFAGAKWSDELYDVNQKDIIYGDGNSFNTKGYEIYAKVFAGQ